MLQRCHADIINQSLECMHRLLEALEQKKRALSNVVKKATWCGPATTTAIR